jgi:hypothetical protein
VSTQPAVGELFLLTSPFIDPLIVIDMDQERWRAVNDVVMGGRSRSSLRFTPSGTAVFSGYVSLDNGGGFASVQRAIAPVDMCAFESLRVRVSGDGKRYQVRLRTHEVADGQEGPFELEIDSIAFLGPPGKDGPFRDNP